MNVSPWSVHELMLAVLAVVLLAALGLIGLRLLQLEEEDTQTVQILATLEGEVPSQLELEVAHHIEDELASLGRMDRIATSIDDGLVTIRVSFGTDRDGEEVLREVRNVVDRVCVDLLSSAASPAVSKLAAAGSMFLTYTVAPLRKASARHSWSVRRPLACA